MESEIFIVMLLLTKKIYKRFEEFWLYSIGGAISFVVDFGMLLVLTEYIGFYYLVSATLSVIMAIVVNYAWQRHVTFKSKEKNLAKQFSKFVVISIIAIGINILLMYIIVDIIHLWYVVAKIIVTIVLWVWNFFGNKYFTFANSQGTMQA